MAIKYMAYDIDWDVDMDEVYECLENMTIENAARTLGLSQDKYLSMSADELHAFAEDKFRHCPGALDDFLGLPSMVELPGAVCPEDDSCFDTFDWSDATDWLADKYGYCINGYNVRRVPIGVYGLTNTASLNVYDINDFCEYVVAAINDSKPGKYMIDYSFEEGDDRLGFFFGEMFIPFDEVMRV